MTSGNGNRRQFVDFSLFSVQDFAKNWAIHSIFAVNSILRDSLIMIKDIARRSCILFTSSVNHLTTDHWPKGGTGAGPPILVGLALGFAQSRCEILGISFLPLRLFTQKCRWATPYFGTMPVSMIFILYSLINYSYLPGNGRLSRWNVACKIAITNIKSSIRCEYNQINGTFASVQVTFYYNFSCP